LSEAQGGDLPAALSTVFHAEHARIYGHAAEAERVEIVSYRIRAVVKMQVYEMTPLADGAVAVEPPRPPRRVYRHGEWSEVAVVRRATLAPGTELKGPLIVEQPDTTVFAPAGWVTRADRYGNLLLTNEAGL
jgi:N-methylhydantoinase A